jgi:PAS domain S-box-containing protein
MNRILYVDDEPGLLEIGKLFLEDDGTFAVDTLPSAVEALDHLKSAHYDVIVSDYQMPGMDGITFLKALRSKDDTTPFIIFTGRGREEIVIEAFNGGADFYLQKGGAPEAQFAELVHKIRQAISRRQAEDNLRRAYERIAASEEQLREQFDELARTEQQVRESERKYRTLVEVNRDIVYSFDPDGIIRYMSPQTFGQMGFHPDEMVGKRFTDFIHPGDAGRLLTNAEKVGVIGSHFTSDQFRVLMKDGAYRWYEDNTIYTTDHKGRPIFMGTLRDVTDRKNAEDAVFESRQMLQLVLDNIPQRVFWKDTSLVFLGCNRPLANDVGYDEPSEMIGKTDYDHSSSSIAEHFRQDDRDVIETGIPKINFEEPQIRPDGSTAWLRTSKVALRNREGKTIGVLGAYEDITGDKKIQMALADSEERYRYFFRTIRDAVFITSPDGRAIDVNDAFLEMFGYSSRDEAIATPVCEVYARPEDRTAIIGKVNDKGFIRDYPVRRRKRDGTVFDASLTVVAQRNPDGSARAYIGLVRESPLK